MKEVYALTALTLLAACGLFKKQREVYDETRPAAAPLRAKVVAAAALVEKRPPVPSSSTCKALIRNTKKAREGRSPRGTDHFHSSSR